MRNFSLNDSTQVKILPIIKRTEDLLGDLSSSINGRDCDAEVVAMPDLGLPHNVDRMVGGFFTGAYYSWESDVPWIPVDATVNSCGVSIYKIESGFETEFEFELSIQTAINKISESSWTWNYNAGNHFITYGHVSADSSSKNLPEGYYLVLHASPAEYKNQFNGLYPHPGNWYSDDIRIFSDDRVVNRYIRYISGVKAERFYRLSKLLDNLFSERNEFVAALVAGRRSITPMTEVLHYGMPDRCSIAIGCQWLDASDPRYLLLTRPGAPLIFIESDLGGLNEVQLRAGVSNRTLTPHGMGVRLASTSDELEVGNGRLRIGDRSFGPGESLRDTGLMKIREFDLDDSLAKILKLCPGTVIGMIDPIFSHFRIDATERFGA